MPSSIHIGGMNESSTDMPANSNGFWEKRGVTKA
ncbi:Uncharacterised protein [Mycobacterium tuberculosis]|nr:Uncharacterised protein [Mycobacterium tuberculosis]